MHDIFISYATTDALHTPLIMAALKQRLDHVGLVHWSADSHLKTGEDWYRAITRQVVQCQAIVIILSPAAAESEWVQFEYRVAAGLRKPIFMIRTEKDPKTGHDLEIPALMARTQIIDYEPADDPAQVNAIIIDKVVDEILQLPLPSRIINALLDGRGLGIGVSVRANVEVITERSISAGIDFQNTLLRRFNLFLDDDREDVKLILTRDAGLEIESDSINRNRNLVLLGGPGGFPYVGTLLEKWIKEGEEKDRGYRFVSAAKHYGGSRFVRKFVKGDAEVEGIEDIVDSEAVADNFSPLMEPSKDGGPASICGLVFTKGFGQDSTGRRVIVLAPINRYLIDGMIEFLLDAGNCDDWYAQLRECGDTSETLFEFNYTYGKAAKFLRFLPPRPLAQLKGHTKPGK